LVLYRGGNARGLHVAPSHLVPLELMPAGMTGRESPDRRCRASALADVPVIVVSGDAGSPRAAADTPAPEELARAGGPAARPRVLVVDDEDAVTRLLAAVLGQAGFDVTAAACGQDAVAAFRSDPAGTALVLMDVQMPGLDGPHTLALLRAIAPGVRCCFMSGNAGRYTAADLQALGAAGMLPKPFPSLADVTRRVSDLARP
jgi:CheY-like chemotaxis protein